MTFVRDTEVKADDVGCVLFSESFPFPFDICVDVTELLLELGKFVSSIA
jgi:hypothetical protein